MLPPVLPGCTCATQGTENIPTTKMQRTKQYMGLSLLEGLADFIAARQMWRRSDLYRIAVFRPVKASFESSQSHAR